MASELTAPGSRALECHAASGVFVIARGAPSDAVRALAAHLAADDDHARVIVDLPADLPSEPAGEQAGQQAGQQASLLRDVLPVLAADPRPLRLIPSNQGLAATTGIGRLIADALGRTVLAHRGGAIAASGGGLFVPPASGAGWVHVRPGSPNDNEPPAPGGPRFPAPRWTVLAPLDQPTMLSQATMAEPLPGGAWLHEPRADGSLAQFALWLAANLAWSDDHVYIVLGHPGAPATPAADIARFLETLPVEARGLVRLVPFGAMSQAKVQPSIPERSALTPHHPPIAPPSIALESGPAEMSGPSAELTVAAGQGTVRVGGEMRGTVRGNGVAGVGTEVRVQPVPGPAASLAAPSRGLAQERQWVRRALAAEFDAAASAVTRVLSQTPGLRAPRDQAADALVDLVAARLYLSGRGQAIDDGARTGEVGPHVPFGRCAAAGLARLPSYRGPARLCAALGDAEWRWYGARTLVTDWAFCPALTDGGAGQPGSVEQPGSVDFLIWSVTARRAGLLAPGGGGHVVFLPGTNFRVLRVRAGQRREVLLRELAPGEVGTGGQVDVIASFDDAAVAGLEKASAAWLGAGAGAGYAGRCCTPPGLVVADASVAAASAASAAGAATGAEASEAHA